MSETIRPPGTKDVPGTSQDSDTQTRAGGSRRESRPACTKTQSEQSEENRPTLSAILAKIKKEVLETIQFKSKLKNHKDLPGREENSENILKSYDIT